jgi:hypothetical protein
MPRPAIAFQLAAALLAITPSLRADIIELSDGRRFTGSMSRNGDIVTIRTDDGKTVAARPAEIARVTLTSNTTPEEAATAEWVRIAPQVKAADDIHLIISIYQNFLDKFPEARQSADAKASLAYFQTLAKSDPVKFRGRWLARAQIEVLLNQWKESARPALDLYKAGRMKETLDALKAPLAEDAQNPEALTLAGLAAYRLNTIPAARTQFTALAAADPTSLLAENNLAVISFLQRQNGEGLSHYVKALQISTDNRQVLDNIAEGINTYLTAGGDKNGLSYRALLKIYEPAELRMQQQMAKLGLQRWGSTWVTRERAAELTKFADSYRDRLAQIDAQNKRARDTIASLDAQIRQCDSDYEMYLQTFNAFNNQLNVQGNAVRIMDLNYFIAQRDIALQNMERSKRQKEMLIAQRDQYVAGTHDFFAQVDKLKSTMTAAGPGLYGGTQRILDLGEAENPPAPAAVPDPGPLPSLQLPAVIIAPPTAPPTLVPVPTGSSLNGQ